MSEKDDEDWIALMGGAPVEGASERTRAEAERFRVVIREIREAASAAPAAVSFDSMGVWRRIEARGQALGAFPPGPVEGSSPAPSIATAAATATRSKTRSRTKFWAGLSGLGAAILAMFWFGLQPAMVGLRGDAESLPPIHRSDPQAVAQTIAAELRSAGAKVTLDVVPSAAGPSVKLAVDAGGSGRPSEAVDAVLARFDVARATQARFIVEVRPIAAPK